MPIVAHSADNKQLRRLRRDISFHATLGITYVNNGNIESDRLKPRSTSLIPLELQGCPGDAPRCKMSGLWTDFSTLACIGDLSTCRNTRPEGQLSGPGF